MKRQAKQGGWIGVIVMIVAGAAYLGGEMGWWPKSSPVVGDVAADDARGVTVRDLFDARTSDTVLTTDGVVVKLLPDDLEGSRHQKFLIEVAGDITVLIAHNIDLAQRVPLREGDRVTIRGEYEWTDKGGTVHWTHHDPKGRHDDGWIEHEGVRYG